MSTKLIIPDTIEGVKSLLTARGYERAAIVWAYCQPRQGQTSGSSTRSGKYSFEDFAALGITGLRTRKTVAGYWKRWQRAIDDGRAPEVQPGTEVPWNVIDRLTQPAERPQREANARDFHRQSQKLIDQMTRWATYGSKFALDDDLRRDLIECHERMADALYRDDENFDHVPTHWQSK
ncbi:hypothetical protein [Gordonia sp. NPDC003950]